MDSLWTSKNIASLDGSYYEAIELSISQNTFSYLEMFSTQYRKKLQLKITKKQINIANLINIYTNKYTYIIFDENDSK